MSFYLCNTLGFFTQLFPCTLMLFLPFSEDSYRFRRRHIFAGMALMSAVMALVFSIMLHAVWAAWPDRDAGGYANLYMLAAVLLALAAYVWLVQEVMTKKFLVFFSVVFYAAAQYWLVNMLVVPLSSTALYQRIPVYNVIDMSLYLAATAVLLPLEFVFVIRPLGEFNRLIEPGTMRREYIAAILSTAVCFVLMSYCSTVWRTALGWSVIHLRWLLPVSLFLIIDQGVIYWLVFRESIRRQKDNERRRFLDVQRLQYDRIAGEMESTRRMRHDLRHHLNTLGALNAQGKQEDIADYLKQYGTVYDRLAEQNRSGDPVVDSILEYYLTLAGEEDIPVECHIDLARTTGVDAMDMTVLLGNCLENSMEALRQLPAEKRWLSIEMMPSRAMILLRIKNTCNDYGGSGAPAGWEAFASRKGAGHRGVGLYSVAAIAEKYNGSANFQCKDGMFTTSIILNPVRDQQQL